GFSFYKIAIEGMPGAGKTTILLELVAEFDQCVLFPELHPEPGAESEEYCENLEGDIYHQMQNNRMRLIDQLPKNVTAVILDRSFYTNYAYMLAIDQNCNSFEFSKYVQIFHQDFDTEQLDLIIVLDAKPETGLLRRRIRGDKIPEPWTKTKFLNEFRNFYFHELPKLTNTPISYIQTDHLSLPEVRAKVRQEIQKWIPLRENLKMLNKKEEEEKIIDFANEHNLGIFHSRLVNVLGYPTMYFRDHAVVLFENRPFFFSNRALKQMIAKQDSGDTY
ncbi:deoxynucleoside kinase, partial [Candidatus Pacearchaeota archaeon]|nr:deoxynucleoside kinase [Candidatus Pacearchaeota archaeon]